MERVLPGDTVVSQLADEIITALLSSSKISNDPLSTHILSCGSMWFTRIASQNLYCNVKIKLDRVGSNGSVPAM